MARKDRRRFLTGFVAAGAATAITPPLARGSQEELAQNTRAPSALPPNAQVAAAETQTPGRARRRTASAGCRARTSWSTSSRRSTSSTARRTRASSFRGLHESLINYGGNKMPEFLTCMHEESAVAMAHGYFKVAGKPLMPLCHGTVGLQHAAMAIYNAWCDRVPMIVIGGNDLDAATRPPGVPTVPLGAGHQRAGARLHQVGRHAGVAAALRAVVGARLQDRDDAALRAGADLARRGAAAGAGQGHGGEKLYIPRYVPTAPPAGDGGAREGGRASFLPRRRTR